MQVFNITLMKFLTDFEDFHYFNNKRIEQFMKNFILSEILKKFLKSLI